MGPGDRFQFRVFKGVAFGVRFDRWPYKYSFDIDFLCFSVFIGLGPDYLDPEFQPA